MYEAYFGMEHTPFTRDIPVDRLYTSPKIEDALGRLVYVVDRQMFAVVTANPGCGKSTLVRMLDGRLGREKYMLLQKEIGSVCKEQKKKVVCVLGEAHLLGKEMLEELRFLLNYKFDSSSPMSLVLVGQTELWEQKLRLQAYTAYGSGST